MFDMSNYLSKGPEHPVDCTEIKMSEGVPSTRWGHAASTYNGQLYILGGRNESDIIDLHNFNFKTQKWKEIKAHGQMPKPRRRHSSVFVGNSIVMFGGFDGSFFNDMQIMDFQKS
jgi:N-acetylneuraminic acid mutarotase